MVIDQFEELITTCKQQEREQFLNFLAEVLEANAQKLHIIITLRSDFEPRFLDSALKPYWSGDRFPVRAMRSDELRQAIERPANEKMLDFDPPNLVDLLIDEVGQMPGSLSLLSFTLSELYTKCIERESRTLTEADYQELGGVAGSLTHRATQLYNKLDKAQQLTMQRVMLRMVTIEGGESARRRVPLSELIYINDAENTRVEEIRQRLDKARLIVGGQETGGEPYVEPAHDALVRGWNKLQEWKNEEQENLLLQQRLTPAANDWDRNNRPIGLLLPDGDRLNQLEKILKSTNNWLNQRETEFIKSSIKLAKERYQVNLSRQLAVQSELTRNQQANLLQRSVLLAVEAMKRLDDLGIRSLETDQALRHGLVLLPRPLLCINHEGIVNAIAFSPDSNSLATTSQNDYAVRVWKMVSGREVMRLNHEYELDKVIFSPDGKYIATAGLSTIAQIWEAATGKKIAQMTHEKYVEAIAFSPNGKYLATTSRSPLVQIWKLTTGKEVVYMLHNEGWVYSVTFSPDGKYLATASSDQTARLWEVSTGKELKCMPHNKSVKKITFSPDGKYLATLMSGDSRFVYLWEVATLDVVRLDHTFDVESIAYPC
ncbi:peptidase C14 caspase catalytic subunit p20 [Calothrix sp. NIES-4101]|nr:peptidase C14 caspase catalytic subunit p20 [Calothrix sp. NIES-4101]